MAETAGPLNPFEELAKQGADAATTFERLGFVWIKKSEAVELQVKLALAVCEATRGHIVESSSETGVHICHRGPGPCQADIARKAKALLGG